MFSDRVPGDQRAPGRRPPDPRPHGVEPHPLRVLLGRGRHPPPLYEPHPQGLASARESVARYYEEKGTGVRPRDLFLTASTSARGETFRRGVERLAGRLGGRYP